MNEATVRALCALNNEFYAKEAASFSATREAPWDGWRRVLRHVAAARARAGLGERASFSSCTSDGEREPICSGGAPFCPAHGNDADDCLSLVDVASGNMRFERFLDAEYPGDFCAIAVDSCDDLALSALRACDFGKGDVAFHHVDVIETLLDGGVRGLALSFGTKSADAAVGFGFMHHIPGEENRVSFLEALLKAVRPGGVVAASLWRFMDDERLAAKAHEATDRAKSLAADAISGRISLDEETARSPLFAVDFMQFEEGDYLLGWQNDTAAFRYCHSFSNREIEALVSSVAGRASLVDRFSADGKSGRLNEYLVFRKE